MNIFVISLDASTERREAMQAQLRALGLTAEIFAATDGRLLPADGPHYNGRRRRLFYGKDMSVGEIGCARSHIAVCEEIIRRNIDCALVLEDDAVLLDGLPQALLRLQACAGEWDIVRFLDDAKTVGRSRVVRDLGGGFSLGRVYGTPGGAYAYVLNRHAAQKLARAGGVTWTPSDTLHGQVWRHGLRVRSLLPSPVRPDMVCPSTIGDSRFRKARQLEGFEKIVFPFTRAGFKFFDALAKQAFFRVGRLCDLMQKGNGNDIRL